MTAVSAASPCVAHYPAERDVVHAPGCMGAPLTSESNLGLGTQLESEETRADDGEGATPRRPSSGEVAAEKLEPVVRRQLAPSAAASRHSACSGATNFSLRGILAEDRWIIYR